MCSGARNKITHGLDGREYSFTRDDTFLQGVRALPTLREWIFFSGGEYSFTRNDAARARTQKRFREQEELEDDVLTEYFSGNVAEFGDPLGLLQIPHSRGCRRGAADASLKPLKPAKRSRAPQER
jgi:hypothetical protein